ncbi:MSMEG_1061 family FMN-dependent PPOX-type flavoprotein [Dermacoccaceae bacterium W4C1]
MSTSAQAPTSAAAQLPTITNEEELIALIGEPSAAARDKVQTELTEEDRGFLAASPLCFVATRGSAGGDVSPKGDPPGFAIPLDSRTIAIPERAGNKRMDGFKNILIDPSVALIFLIPGLGYTLRINGQAQLVTDGPFFTQMEHRGHRPKLAMVVAIDEVFNHCPKAFMRSKTWDPQSWDPAAVTNYAALAQRKWRRNDPPEEVAKHYSPAAYADQLYPSAD